jgi:hypothetical protein
MRRARALVVACLWLVAGVVAVGTCAAVPAVASAAPDDLVSGAGEVDFGTLGRVSLTGHGTATDAQGTMRIDIPAFLGDAAYGTIDCVNVQGNRANVSGRFAQPPVAFPTVEYFLLSITDNGPPSAGNALADTAVGAFSFAPEDCAAFPFSTGGAFVRGNVTVKDMTP